MFDVAGKTAVITGSASGIGLATAELLLEKGSNVVLSDYNEANLEKEYARLSEKYGERVSAKFCNVAVEENVKALVEFAVEKYGELDIMFNNAGVTGLNEKIDAEDEGTIAAMQRTLNINLNGVIYGTRYSSMQMIKQGHGGVILSTASIFGHISSAMGSTAYCASKHAVVGLTKTWGLELAPHQIRVSALCPGYTLTGLCPEELLTQELLDMLLPTQPLGLAMGRFATAEEMAHAALFMIENTFYTGQSLIVDGGYTAQ